MNPIALFQIVDGMAFLAAALLLSVWLTNRSALLSWWSGAYFIGGCGVAFIIWCEWQSVRLSYGLGATIVLVAYGMLWLGVRTQSAQPHRPWWWFVLPALVWFLLRSIPLLQDSELLRLVVFSPIAALCMAAIAWEATRIPGRPAARWPLVGVSLVHAVFYLARTLSLLMHEGEILHQIWFYSTGIEAIAFIFSDAFLAMSLAGAQREDRLESEAHSDFLTGVLNRRGFTLLAEERLRKPPVSLLLLDADHFKSINDQLGHAEGDNLLRDLARACRESVRGEDLVGRLGGDEFVILISGPSDLGINIAQRISSAFEERARPYGVGVSIGIVHYAAGDARSLAELLEAADRDLYQAKGRRPLASP